MMGLIACTAKSLRLLAVLLPAMLLMGCVAGAQYAGGFQPLRTNVVMPEGCQRVEQKGCLDLQMLGLQYDPANLKIERLVRTPYGKIDENLVPAIYHEDVKWGNARLHAECCSSLVSV